MGDCADLRQDGPGSGHRAGDAAHDDHEEEDAEEENEEQNKIAILNFTQPKIGTVCIQSLTCVRSSILIK